MKTLTPIGKFEILSINGLINNINKVAKCDFIKVSYKKLERVISVVFEIEGKIIVKDNEETALAFLDGIYIWAESEN